VRACPFLTQRELERRTIGLPEEIADAPGLAIKHNPGVALLWVTKSYRPWQVPVDAIEDAGAQVPDRINRGGVLFELGEPVAIRCYREGRPATRAEVEAAIEQGLPHLHATAVSQGPRAVAALVAQVAAFGQLLEAHL
jgi:hypothetical protein